MPIATSPALAHRRRRTQIPAAMASAVLLACLAACGGGGSDSEEPPVDKPTATTLKGVVATGAAVASAPVVVTDASGKEVCAAVTDPLGAYTCTLPADAARPLLIRAGSGDATLYSTTAAAGDSVANVTPLTTIITARLAPDGNPANLQGTLSTVTAASIQAQITALIDALKPLLAALGLPATLDPLAGALVANGTGQDKLLDSISVSVVPDGTGSNIEVTVKTVPTAGDSKPISLQFSSSGAITSKLPDTVAVAAVPAPDVLANLVTRLNACFALPLSKRVTATADDQPVTGSATDVIAPECKTLFVNDDPATYLSNGSRVGRNANNQGSFAGLFRPGATGLLWSNAKVEFFRTANEMVISLTTTSKATATTPATTATDTYVVRNVSGALKVAGNQNVYSAVVRPWADDREFLNAPQFNYNATGYNIRVNNVTASGNSIFSKVLVTSPTGEKITLLPAAGQSLLAIEKDGNPTGTSVLRIGSAYRDAALVADAPSVKEPSLIFASPQLSDAAISRLQNQGVWTFEFFHVDSGTPNVTQYNRPLSRPYTIAEFRAKPLADFTTAFRNELKAETAATGYSLFDVSETAQLGDSTIPAWSVPAGALAPSSVSIYGRGPNNARFDDNVGVSATTNWVVIPCTPQSLSDMHCAGNGLYAVNTTVNMVELWGLDARQTEISKKLAFYKLQ